jgi:hypothetical protein
VAGETNTDYLPRVYPHGFSIPKLSETHFEVLEGVASVLEAIRSIRLNQTTKALWDFVVLNDEVSTEIAVAQVGKDFVVCRTYSHSTINSECILYICILYLSVPMSHGIGSTPFLEKH